MSEHIGRINSLSEPDDKNGKKYVKIVVEPSKWTYSIFQDTLKQKARSNNGAAVVVEYDEDGIFRTLTDIIEKPADIPMPTDEPSNDMSKAEWAIKDRIISRVAIAKNFIDCGYFNNPDEAFDWVYELKHSTEATESKSEPVDDSGFDALQSASDQDSDLFKPTASTPISKLTPTQFRAECNKMGYSPEFTFQTILQMDAPKWAAAHTWDEALIIVKDYFAKGAGGQM